MCRKQWDKYLENGSPVYCKYCPSAKKKNKKKYKITISSNYSSDEENCHRLPEVSGKMKNEM